MTDAATQSTPRLPYPYFVVSDPLNIYLDSIASDLDPRVEFPLEWAQQDEGVWSMRDDMRVCTRCTRLLPANPTYFVSDAGSKTLLGGYCRRCNAERTKDYARSNHDKYIAGIQAAHRKQFAGQGLVNAHRVHDGVVDILVFDGDGREHTVVVDQADLYLLLAENTSWYINPSGYAQRMNFMCGRPLLMHMVIVGVTTSSSLHTDHIDRDKMNNRRGNLRLVSNSTNALNRKLSANNTTGFPGVLWVEKDNSWKVQVQIQGRRTCKQFQSFTAACNHARNMYIAAGVPAINLPQIPASAPVVKVAA